MLPIEHVALKLVVGNFKKRMNELNPLSKFPAYSTPFLLFAAKIPFPFWGSFAAQTGDYFRSLDALLSNLGIV